ncbi:MULTISPECIES: RNA polymerase sigma factor [unclassified Fusibacter]|uniref:RNA polymerase sigma factor n=1 Tax=unclassified Fusibacter TaxID=2624464 RepID=UPI001012234D|nr:MULTISPECIES: RNA polymerase sigma factor [unclassified Fusibacter]MCK8060206.1 RNA polymerase sigma factor [Fusibacter sp. A2]NPE22346.1 RNA polymerase sigma factor [Fusibacter sp. A1]RXV61119.1 RNA polymerase sigma factor [Fusibacter sp. A1]
MEEKKLKQLIKKSVNGHQKAFEKIMYLHGNQVLGYLMKLCANKEFAEDVYQEVWIKVYRKLNTYDQTKAFEPWLFTIARNTAFDFLKKHKNDPIPTIDEILLQDVRSSTPHESPMIETESQIHTALEQLSEMNRQIVVLRYMSDLSYDQIAKKLDCDVSTIKWRLYESKKQLKKFLEQKEDVS